MTDKRSYGVYDSGLGESLVLSYDGWGNDGSFVVCARASAPAHIRAGTPPTSTPGPAHIRAGTRGMRAGTMRMQT
jgi:hypothetical protein